MLLINNLSVKVQEKKIINDFSYTMSSGAVHALMGPNGSGKSSLAFTLMGHPSYQISSGTILFDNVDITELSPDKRARLGLFLSLQHPVEIPGLTVFNFLKESYYALHSAIGIQEFQQLLYASMDFLGMDHAFAYRNMHEGFSGGEKKRLELLQLLLFKPKLAILDEIDSGLDVDAQKMVSSAIARVREQCPTMSIMLITHYQRLLEHIKPDVVLIMHAGKLVCSGDAMLAQEIELQGYDGSIHPLSQKAPVDTHHDRI